jgi:DNA-directed RNA polymerase subunit RPC12/RpoP
VRELKWKLKARWNITLMVWCRSCHRNVDLMKAPNFWDGRENGLQAGDDGEDEKVTCPNCGYVFVCDFE